MPRFEDMGLAVNCALFAAAAIAVWFAGSRISHYADAISKKTGMGHALLGLILLAGVTSLPELGVTVTSAASGNAKLAVNNLFGSIAMQVAVLAVIDFVIGRRALTAVVPEPALMLQGALNVLLISIAAAGMVAGDVAFLGIGVWAWACLVGYVCSVWLLSQTEGRRPWLAAHQGRVDSRLRRKRQQASNEAKTSGRLSTVLLRTAAVAAVILAAGYVLSRSGEAIAEISGLGSSFVGFAVLATSTSLPEFSAALAAARLGLFTLAISDILGTNLINIGLLFVVDAVAPGEPVLGRVGSFALFGAVLSIALTAVFVAGLAERRDRTVWRMGIDSIVVLAMYAGGLVLLYSLRDAS
jgi:cation:H+ antiporter